MAQADLDVCNQAIAKAGGARIDALDEETPLGGFCLASYPGKAAWLLSRHRWIFAKKIARLQLLTTPPDDSPLAYAFAPPDDSAGAIHDFRSGADERADKVQALQLAGYVAADAATLYVEYTARVPENRWPPWFEQLVVTAFAADIARAMGRRSQATELDQQAFGTPELNGEGGLYLSARQEDSRNAPARALAYEAGGPLVGVRHGTGWPAFSAGVTVIIEP